MLLASEAPTAYRVSKSYVEPSLGLSTIKSEREDPFRNAIRA